MSLNYLKWTNQQFEDMTETFFDFQCHELTNLFKWNGQNDTKIEKKTFYTLNGIFNINIPFYKDKFPSFNGYLKTLYSHYYEFIKFIDYLHDLQWPTKIINQLIYDISDIKLTSAILNKLEKDKDFFKKLKNSKTTKNQENKPKIKEHKLNVLIASFAYKTKAYFNIQNDEFISFNTPNEQQLKNVKKKDTNLIVYLVFSLSYIENMNSLLSIHYEFNDCDTYETTNGWMRLFDNIKELMKSKQIAKFWTPLDKPSWKATIKESFPNTKVWKCKQKTKDDYEEDVDFWID